jgi:hypothetical protein
VHIGFGATGTLAYNSGSGRAGWLDWVAPAVNLPGGFRAIFEQYRRKGRLAAVLSQRVTAACGIWALTSIAIWSLSRSIHVRCAPETISRPALAAVTLVAVLSAGVASTWAIAGAPHIITTRAQLRLIAGEDPRATRLGVQLTPLSGHVLGHRAATPGSIDVTTRSAPGRCPVEPFEVPPGDYQLRLSFVAEPRGHIRLLVGGAGEPVANWDVSGS